MVIQFGWRDGAPNGVYAYDPADDETAIVSDYAYQIGGNTVFASLPLASLGLAEGQSVAVSAFQEGLRMVGKWIGWNRLCSISTEAALLRFMSAMLPGTWETAVETFPNWVPGWLGINCTFP